MVMISERCFDALDGKHTKGWLVMISMAKLNVHGYMFRNRRGMDY